jgi:aryl-phospho-beta-D-glucosidase BglC (GH1 family)
MGSYHFHPGNARDLVKDGIWFRDAQKRYCLFRGVNFASRSKHPPYLPVLPLDSRDLPGIERVREELAGVSPWLDLLRQLGFNVVRLLLMWKALEPRPNLNAETLLPEGVRYLALIKEVVDALYLRGLFVFLDFHQDIAHEVYGGDGFPNWALAIDRDHPRPPQAAFKDTMWGLLYYAADPDPAHYYVFMKSTAKLVRKTLVSFWKNHLENTELSASDLNIARPVRTHLEQTIGATARYFQSLNGGQGHPAILGYELFNEPHPVGFPKQQFEGQELASFYQNARAAIRRPSSQGLAGDSKGFIFIEPRMDWNIYPARNDEDTVLDLSQFTLSPVTYLPTDGLKDDRVVFSFHHYDPWTLEKAALLASDDMHKKMNEWPDFYRQMKEAATSRGLIPFLTEFGGNQDWVPTSEALGTYEAFKTDLSPNVYYGQQIRAYMDLQFQQIERHVLNATYWNFDLYNTAAGKDNWNLENFSLLGPGRSQRNLDIVARPYPMRSSAQPTFLSFDLESKQFAIFLNGPVVPEPTVLFLPISMHYLPAFDVRGTGTQVQFDLDNQQLFWWPDPHRDRNVLIIHKPGKVVSSLLPSIPSLLYSELPALFAWHLRHFIQPVHFSPDPLPVDKPVTVTVDARDAETSTPVAVWVQIDGRAVSTTNNSFTHTFAAPRIHPPPKPGIGEPVVDYPSGLIGASGYESAPLQLRLQHGKL